MFFISQAMAHAQGLRLCALEIIAIIIMIIHTASSDMQCATTYLSTQSPQYAATDSVGTGIRDPACSQL